MLKLLLFAACEKVIVGVDNTTSLISVVESIEFNTQIEIPPDALAPIKWAIISLWQREGEVEAPVDYQERMDVIRPDGTLAPGGSSEFTVTNEHINYRSSFEIPLFPIGQAGKVIVRLRIRKAGEENEWRVAAEYPIRVIHNEVKKDEEPAIEEAESGGVHALSGTNPTSDGSTEEGTGQTEG
jgi:hypothetical protein